MYRPIVHYEEEEHSISYMQLTYTYFRITTCNATINKLLNGVPIMHRQLLSSTQTPKSPRPQQNINKKASLAQTSLAKPEGEEM